MFDFNNIEIKLLDETFIETLSQETDYDYDLLKNYITTSIEEAKHTLEMVSKYDLKDKHILEFGAGLGIASIVLKIHGYDITSFEPGGLGFEKNSLLIKAIKKYFDLEFNLINVMSDVKNASFDFIFSNNVLEHINNIEDIILQLDKALIHNGKMLHNVPNYIIPYEPHFGILFFPIFPKKMSFLISKKITDTDLWKSINFINVFDVTSYAKSANAKVVFEKQLIYKTIQRIEIDEEFAKRHTGISKIINILKKLGVLRLFQLFPVSLNTPMVFEWSKND